jgi:hypothetical protein
MTDIIKTYKEKNLKSEGKWHMGHIALFGAILMSKGIYGKEKQMLKDLMLQALNGDESSNIK